MVVAKSHFDERLEDVRILHMGQNHLMIRIRQPIGVNPVSKLLYPESRSAEARPISESVSPTDVYDKRDTRRGDGVLSTNYPITPGHYELDERFGFGTIRPYLCKCFTHRLVQLDDFRA